MCGFLGVWNLWRYAVSAGAIAGCKVPWAQGVCEVEQRLPSWAKRCTTSTCSTPGTSSPSSRTSDGESRNPDQSWPLESQGTQTNPWLLEWGRAQGTQTGDGDETDLEKASEAGTLKVSPTEPAHSPTVSVKEEKEEEEPTMLVDEGTRKNLPLVVEKNKVKEELRETKKELAAVKKEIKEEPSEEMAVNKASAVLPPGPKLAESPDSSSSSSSSSK